MISSETAEALQAGRARRRPCRFCRAHLEETFVDLGMSPLSNAYLKAADLSEMEPFYPLHAYVCSTCFLVQLEEKSSPQEIFSDYAYFSSFSESWLEHSRRYAQMAVERFNLDRDSMVIEIGSNDGYLLRYFMEAGIPVLGIDPASNVARTAREKGLETLDSFFNSQLAGRLAEEGKKADLLIGNNVLAHIPDLNDLITAFKKLLHPAGVISLEFPHLLSLIEQKQFDTIYHEHYSYFSLTTAERIFAARGLRVFDAELLETHGGSLRIYACHEDARSVEQGGSGKSEGLEALLLKEQQRGLKDIETYRAFGEQVKMVKREILKFVIGAKEQGKSIAAYGAPAKGNTLLNYCGIGPDFIDYTVDRSPHKQGRYLPGSHIPIFDPEMVEGTRPDYLIILPWNLKSEIMEQMELIRAWDGQFVVLIPEVKVF